MIFVFEVRTKMILLCMYMYYVCRFVKFAHSEHQNIFLIVKYICHGSLISFKIMECEQ